jgi:hypothetical protein
MITDKIDLRNLIIKQIKKIFGSLNRRSGRNDRGRYGNRSRL